MKRTKRSKKWTSVLVIILVCGAGAQLIRPDIGHPAVTEDVTVPDDLKQILKKSCYNCHSNETNLAWFDKITPANWLVADHIREGRKVLNFSNWDSLTNAQQKAKLFEALYQADHDAMPLKQYILFHPGSKLTGGDIAVFKNYLLSLTPGIYSDTVKARAGDRQYKKWLLGSPGSVPAGSASPRSATVTPEYNGIGFIQGFRDWQVVSTTERFDNGTLRAILGNDIAVRAIREHHTNPWPDGVIFAKVAWDQANDPTGKVYTGEFRQVEFMIKDKNKYASTEGWGFARWIKGLDLVPYGKNASFVTECANCHRPMKDNDYTFTMPLHPLQTIPEDSSLAAIQGEKLITSLADKRDKTMSSLYGNDIAVNAARSGLKTAYPPGSVLSLITWHQKEDSHWFGANIPGPVSLVEQWVFGPDSKNASSPSYTIYEGLPLRKSSGRDTGTVKSRTAWIMDQRASVMP